MESADLVTFTEEILRGKLYFLCSDRKLVRAHGLPKLHETIAAIPSLCPIMATSVILLYIDNESYGNGYFLGCILLVNIIKCICFKNYLKQ